MQESLLPLIWELEFIWVWQDMGDKSPQRLRLDNQRNSKPAWRKWLILGGHKVEVRDGVQNPVSAGYCKMSRLMVSVFLPPSKSSTGSSQGQILTLFPPNGFWEMQFPALERTRGDETTKTSVAPNSSHRSLLIPHQPTGQPQQGQHSLGCPHLSFC